MSAYYQQRPPYPMADPMYGPSPQQSSPQQYLQQQTYSAYPRQPAYQQQQYYPPPTQQQPQQYYPPPTQQQQQQYYPPPAQQPQWNPEKIWAEANGTSQQQSSQPTRSFDQQYGAAPMGNAQPGTEGGERGIGATLVGGGAGAFLGHKMGHGKLATIGGLAAGAIAANMFEHHHEKKKREHRMENAYEDGYVNGESRGIDDRYYDDRRSITIDDDDRDYDEYERPHHHHHHHRDYDDDDDRVDIDIDDDVDYDRRDY